MPVWNGRDLLARLLASLRRADAARPREVIVVDNGSTDGAPELAASAGARVIPMGRNAGFAAAVNRGIRECRQPDWIAVLNSDVELAPDYFEKLAAADAWFATGKILQLRCADRIDGTFDAICRGGTAWRVGIGPPGRPAFLRNARPSLSAPWTAALFRAEIFQRVGLLEERFESYLEDVDFGLRCAAQGIAGVYEPAAVAWHRGSAALGRWHPETVRRIARNQVFLLARHYPSSLLARWMLADSGGAIYFGEAWRFGTAPAWLGRVARRKVSRASRECEKPASGSTKQRCVARCNRRNE